MGDLESELDELQCAIEDENPQQCFEELGDVLFSAVNVARFLKVDSEESLNASTEKFIDRFRKVEELAKEQGIELPKYPFRIWINCGNRQRKSKKGVDGTALVGTSACGKKNTFG